MRISFKQYLKQKMRKASKYYSVGIAFTADQVLLSALQKKGDKFHWVLDASFSHQNWAKGLARYVQEQGLAGTPCYFALSAHWYRIHQIDEPDVAKEDLFLALQWPLKEVLGSEKDFIYDYAEVPVQVSGQKKLLAVAVVKDEVIKLTQVIFDSGLDLKSISVEEFATVQLLENQNEPVISLVQEHGEEVVLNIVKNNQLYFSRRLKGFENIGGYSESELDMGITDSLCVQIQRSMDFFESQLRQAPIRHILTKLDSPHVEFLCERISSAMGVKCEAFEPKLVCNDKLNFTMASFSCLGAAYSAVTANEDTAANTENSKNKETEEQVEVTN